MILRRLLSYSFSKFFVMVIDVLDVDLDKVLSNVGVSVELLSIDILLFIFPLS